MPRASVRQNIKIDIARNSQRTSGSSERTAFVGSVLFASGVAALIYQVLWIKQLSLVVGVDVYAITTGVSAFFAGLALGGAVFGRQADSAERPLLLYALLEFGVAGLGVAATVAFAHSALLFVALEAHVGLLAWALPFVLMAVPAYLMGGTLPIIVRAQMGRNEPVARTGGSLYACNTAGAIAGALLTPFFLIPSFGVRGTAFAAAVVNLAAAFGSLILDRRASLQTPAHHSPPSGSAPPQARVAFILYALAGGVALGYEVVWSQAIVQFTSTRSFAFAIVLATYLAGLATGSGLYSRFADRIRNSWEAFGLFIGLAGLVALLEIACLGNWFMNLQSDVEEVLRALTGSELEAMCGRFLVASLGIVVIPATLLGAAFPAALRLGASATQTGRDVGAILAFNTAGGIAGTLLTGFFLVPALGLVHSLAVLAVVAAALGVVAATREPGHWRGVRPIIFGVGLASMCFAIWIPQDRFANLLTATRSGGKVIFYKESRGSTVAVVEQGQADHGTFRRLYIQGVSNSGDAMPSLRYMRLQALLPLIIHRDEARSALVIGFGTGITAGALLRYPKLERRVCAELLPSVVDGGRLFHGNFDAASSPQIDIRLRDGRRELLRNRERYDLITLEPPPPSAAGVVNLYSTDFYRLVRARLEPNGMIAQWWPLPTQNNEDSQSLVRSFLDVFPYTSLWTTELHEMLLIGSTQPIELDAARISERFQQTEVASALSEVGIDSPAELLATWVTGREGLERYAGRALPVTDDRPAIEYATWVRRGEIIRVLPRVLAFQTDPPIRGADIAFKTAVTAEHQRLLMFYEAALQAYRGDRQQWARIVQRVLREDGSNLYFRWAVRGN